MNFVYKHLFPLLLESGETLPTVEVSYTIFGNLNKDKSNVIWIVHALTGNSNPMDWWGILCGKDKVFDPDKYFIICCNNLGSCYGTTGPASINPNTNEFFKNDFPFITIRDMTNILDLVRAHLKIDKIKLLLGGSQGGQITLEWAIQKPDLFEKIAPIATSSRHSAWGIAFNEAQRMALELGEKGIEVARAIAMISYRSYESYLKTQTDSIEIKDNFMASSYQRYQGKKLRNRFDSHCYYTLSKAMDSHNIGRGRNSEIGALKQITAETLVIGISSDLLFPIAEQIFLAENINNCRLEIIDSTFGHDGFLVEQEKLTKIIEAFLQS